jgi:hypothetical protein
LAPAVDCKGDHDFPTAVACLGLLKGFVWSSCFPQARPLRLLTQNVLRCGLQPWGGSSLRCKILPCHGGGSDAVQFPDPFSTAPIQALELSGKRSPRRDRGTQYSRRWSRILCPSDRVLRNTSVSAPVHALTILLIAKSCAATEGGVMRRPSQDASHPSDCEAGCGASRARPPDREAVVSEIKEQETRATQSCTVVFIYRRSIERPVRW